MEKALPLVIGLLLVGLSGATPVLADGRGTVGEPPLAHAIGDSVLLGAREELRDAGISVDAVEGRQPKRLIGAVQDLPEDGRPLVIHLGTNGLFDKGTCHEFRNEVDGERDVVLVTIRAPRPWVSKSNDMIRSCAGEFEESTAVVAPWHRMAVVQPNLVYSDGIHLRPAGTEVFVDLIQQRLGLCPDFGEPKGEARRAQVGHDCPAALVTGRP